MKKADVTPRRVPIQMTPGFSFQSMPVGYNQAGYVHRLVDAKDSHIPLHQQNSYAAYSDRPIDMQNFGRWNNQMNRSQFVWDKQPELVRLPITGSPDKFSTQYVMYDVLPVSNGVQKKPIKPGFVESVRRVFLAKPKGITNG